MIKSAEKTGVALNTPALDSSEEWTALIEQAETALRQAGEI